MTSKNQDDLGRQWQCSPLIPTLGKKRQNLLCCLSSSFEKALNMQNIYREYFQNSLSLISLKLHESKEHCKKDGWKANSITKKFISDMKTVSTGFPAQLVDSLAVLILSMRCYLVESLCDVCIVIIFQIYVIFVYFLEHLSFL